MKSRMRKVKMYSRVYAKIDLDAIHHNMEAMHALLKEDTKIFAVIKTDGYGHGAVPIAKEIESLDYRLLYGNRGRGTDPAQSRDQKADSDLRIYFPGGI